MAGKLRDVIHERQSGFQRYRGTADALADVVHFLEEARPEKEESYLLLLDVKSEFHELPHQTIRGDLNALGADGRLNRFLRDSALRV